MDFSNKTYREHLILSSPEKWGGGGIWVCVFNFLDDLLYCGYNTGSNNSAWKGQGGGSGGPPLEKNY